MGCEPGSEIVYGVKLHVPDAWPGWDEFISQFNPETQKWFQCPEDIHGYLVAEFPSQRGVPTVVCVTAGKTDTDLGQKLLVIERSVIHCGLYTQVFEPDLLRVKKGWDKQLATVCERMGVPCDPHWHLTAYWG